MCVQQLRAPGSPVIIVGTYLDAVTETKAKELEEAAMQKYNNPTIYPKVKVPLVHSMQF